MELNFGVDTSVLTATTTLRTLITRQSLDSVDWVMGKASTGAQPRLQSSGVQFRGLGYCTEQNTDGIPNFVHCSVQLRKKLGWSVQIFFGVSRPPPMVAPLSDCINLLHRAQIFTFRSTPGKQGK